MTPTYRKSLIIILVSVFGSFSVVVLLGAALLWSWSPGTPRPYTDNSGASVPGSIAEKLFLNINGARQGMFIKTVDSTHPVLLYLHGGMPEYFLTQTYPTDLEKYFTVCWWEQRGSGLSYDAHRSLDEVTTEQLILDTKEVTMYLRTRFKKEKIYLLGHSGGSYIGIQAAARFPELYHAYIGMAQISNQLKSEQRAYDYMLEQFRKTGDRGMTEKLEASPVTVAGGIPESYYGIRDRAMHSLGIGTTHDMRSILSGIFLPSLQFPEYSFIEKINLWQGKIHTGVSSVWKEIEATNLDNKITFLDIPVYFLHGVFDYTVSYPEAKALYRNVKAPAKGFYTFGQSAHSPLFEEPEKAITILCTDVLRGNASLADDE